MSRFVEISHVIQMGMRTFPGMPLPTAEVVLDYDASRPRYDDKAEFFIASLHLCGNTGTYVDSPKHRYRDGIDLSRLPLESVAHVPVTVIDGRGSREQDVDRFEGVNVAGHAVLVRTDFSDRFGTDAYFEQGPFLTAAACRLLVERGAVLVGIDGPNIDALEDLSRPAHTILLGAGVPVCEHMTNLAAVPDDGYLHAVPIAWAGGATFPVRAYVVVP